MRNRNNTETSTKKPDSFDPDSDRYPQLAEAFRALLQSDRIPDGPVERIEVTCLANGDITGRVWPPRAVESEGVHIPAQDG
jgi:hypothetical protein